MNEYFYAREKLITAMHSLATDPGDVRSRLLNAFMSFHTLKESDFPKELQNDWTWIMEQLTRYKPITEYEKKDGIRSLYIEKNKKLYRRKNC